jgi:hypothetical protein
VKVIGDERPVIPLQQRLRIEYRDGAAWKTAAQVRDATNKTIVSSWPAPLETDALRLYVPAPDLPKSTRPDIPDGVVRVCELVLLLPDGKELTVPDFFGK